MQLWVSEENLPFFMALASPVRIKIIKRLAQGEANIKDLAEEIGVSSAMMTSHIKKLENAGLVMAPASRKQGKMCSLINQWYTLRLPTSNYQPIQNYEVQLDVGHYTKAEITPTCGLASTEKIIGTPDDPRAFYDPERFQAELLWFTQGYVEYEIPNYVPDEYEIVDIEISAEMCSEYPHIKNNWESDINIYLNGELVCPWVSPGDFGDRTGKYTPSWWLSAQYGILKKFSINKDGVFLDKKLKSNKSLQNYHLDKDHWSLRFEASDAKRRAGGLTIFGKHYGDFSRGIIVKINYQQIQP